MYGREMEKVKFRRRERRKYTVEMKKGEIPPKEMAQVYGGEMEKVKFRRRERRKCTMRNEER